MDLLESLTVEGVAELQLIFERNDGLTSDTFVKVFRSLLEKESQPDAIFRWTSTALRAFFAEIDVDGNGKVDWEEFTDFVISSRKHVGYQPSQRGIRLQLDVGPSAVSLFPNQCAHLHRLIYFSDVSKAIAASVSRITVHDMSSAGYPTIATLSVPGKMSDAVYIAENACIAVSTESGDLACFDTSSDFREIGSYRAHMPILRLCAPRNSSVLVGGDSSGFLNILERNRVCTRSFTNSVYLPKGKKYHTSAVVSLFTTPKALVTVGMDATIHLVDLETNTSLYSLPTFHTKLIRDAALNDYESNIIVTCGEGSRAGVLFADHRHQSPAYLEDSAVPHGGQLAGVSTVVGKCEVASVDELGMIKLWDLRMLRCLTTAFVPHTIERKMEDVCGSALPKSISGITCTESKAYILGPSVCSYNRHECAVSVSTHEEPIVAVAYIQTSQLIVTCTCTEIAVWSVRSGVKQSTFFTQVADRTMGGSITSMSVDKTHNSRRLIIGTHNGYILSLLLVAFALL
jgi:WD40 repeat protein